MRVKHHGPMDLAALPPMLGTKLYIQDTFSSVMKPGSRTGPDRDSAGDWCWV